MFYLIASESKSVATKKIKDIITLSETDDINQTFLDVNDNSMEEIIEAFQTIPFFGDKKVVVVHNVPWFAENSKETTIFEEYLKKPNPEVIHILIPTKIDNRKALAKEFKAKHQFIDLNNQDLTLIVKEMVNPYTFEEAAIKELIRRLNENIDNLQVEIDKIKTFKGNDKSPITKEEVIKLTIDEHNDNDIFTLIDLIINGQKKEALKLYRELLKYNGEVIAMVSLVASRIRSLYQVSELLEKGVSDTEIASLIGMKPGALYYMKPTIRKVGKQKLKDTLKKLSELDYQIKSGATNKEVAFEMFILNF